MGDINDIDLLRDYERQGAEDAFAEVVRRHIAMVYSAAFRQVGVAAQAEEITQAVFIILARKAGTFRQDTILESWLYETTRLTALSFLRGERRRQMREQEAYMQSTLEEGADSAAWKQLSPMLEEAMGRLGQKEREAVILRFFKEKSLREVAVALEVNDAVAQKRVHRAIEKLRLFFSKRGVALSGVVIMGAITANSVQAAPAGLANLVTVAAITKGTAASGSTLTLIKGALKIMAWAKAKMMVAASVAVLLAAGTTVVVVEKVGSQGVDESFWELKNLEKNFEKCPPVLIIRPTRYPHGGGLVSDTDGRCIGLGWEFVYMLAHAYSTTPAHIVLPKKIPQGEFDLMLMLRKDQKSALRQEIQNKFGFIAHHEYVETKALALRVNDPSLLADHRSSGDKLRAEVKANDLRYSNVPISVITDNIELMLALPVVAQSGCAGNFDVTIKWPIAKRSEINDDLEEVGLELVPALTRVEMLVVEKASSQAGKHPFLEPLSDNDYASRTDSALQGSWEATIKWKDQQSASPVSLRIAERADKTYRAEAKLALEKPKIQATAFRFIPPQVIINFNEEGPHVEIEGNLTDDGKEIKGIATVGRDVMPITFKRVEGSIPKK